MLQTKSETSRGSIAWIAAALIIIALAAVLWLFSVRKPSTQKKPDQSLSKTVIRQKMPQNPMLAKRIVTKKVIPAKIPDKPAADTKSQQAPAAEPQTEPKAQIKIDQAEKQKAVAAESPTESMAPIKIDQAEKEKAVAAESLTESQAPIGIIQAETEKTGAPEPVKTALLKRDLQPQTIPQPEAQPAPIGRKSAAPEIQREKWLLSQDGTAYTIQIIGVSSEKTMLDFIKRNGMLRHNKIAYYESTFRGQPWFQLLYGIYPDKQTARLAANKLPENIRQAGPWIRKIATVQKTIENR
jgi:DamX protein